jgi:hypothetical protein
MKYRDYLKMKKEFHKQYGYMGGSVVYVLNIPILSKITTIVAILMAVLLISTAVTPIVYAGGGNIGPNSDNENGYIVKLKKGKARVLIDKAVSELKHIPYTDGLFTADSLEDIKDAVDAGLVEYIERDDEISLLDLPEPLTSDPMIINQCILMPLK